MITGSYVLFIRIPLFKTSAGRLYCDELWAKDLALHLDYIENFKLCCPVVLTNDVAHLADITDLNISEIFPLKMDASYAAVLKNMVPNFWRVFRACRRASIVHGDAAGWPFPFSFFIYFIQPFLTFKWIMVIESSFWMVEKGEKASLRKRFSHLAHKFFLSACVKKADARIFTQSYYRQYFLGDETERTLIAPATWINQEDLISASELAQRNQAREKQAVSLIFPTRLIEDKGVRVLFSAIEALKSRDVNLSVTLMGKGAMEEACRAFTKQDFGSVKVSFRDAVNYGAEFFEVLREYDAVLVPNLKEEQPRIVFDAFSQGLTVIAADTSGVLDVVEPNKNALVFKRGDAKSLADAMEYAAHHREIINQMGCEGLISAYGKTHKNMHAVRLDFFEKVLK